MRRTFTLSALVVVLAATPFAADAANAWMQNARKSPEWFMRGVMYQIQPRAFTPEGTLKAAEKKLAYLKDLGVTIAYLVPVMKMDADGDKSFWSPRQIRSGFDNPKNQYRLANYFHVDDEYGTDQDLKDFCAEAHRLGMKVVFDLVYLHCGPTAPFLREHPEFTWWNPDGTVKKGPWRFPKLNFAEPKLREYLIGNIRYLIREFGADGFRCDVGDGIPLDFWCDAHDMMDGLTGGNAVLLCEGFTVCNQYKGFDADYGWFPGLSAASVRGKWTGRAAQCPVGSKFVNHYENHDIATDARPRREEAWGHAAVDQVLVWMFTLDGVPMLFTGNEMADADERHSMFGKTPMDWSQLDREPGKSRHALVKRLASLRHEHPAFTDVNGTDGLTWLDTTAKDAVTAFVRRNGRETILVVQNWTKKPVKCGVSFTVPKLATASYLAPDETDRDVKGTIAAEPLFARDASYSSKDGFTIGPFGWWISKVGTDRHVSACQKDAFTAYSMLTRDGRKDALGAPSFGLMRHVSAAGAASNAYYRATCETVGGVTRLAHLVKVQKTGDVAVPGTWTVLGGADAVSFENGRIVVKGGLRFDAQGSAFSLTSRGVTFGEGTTRYQIGLDGKRTNVTKDGFTLEPHPNTPGGVTWLDLTWQSVPPALDPAQLAINHAHRIKFMHPLPRLRNGTVPCSVNNNPELAIPGVLTAQGKDIGFFMKTLRDVVSANRRLIFLDGKTIVCNHNWIRDHAHQMKGWCHWERDCLSFLQLIIDRQRPDGMFYELVKQLDDGHWTMVEDTSRVLFPEDNLALARLDLEADVEYLVVEAAHLYWRMTGDDDWMASVLPKLEKGISWQTSDPQRWNAAYGLCIRPFTIDTWDFVPMESTGPDRRIRPWEPMPAFHGDNTGVWQAMRQLAAMNERLGRNDRAADWRRRADTLKANIFKHLWNGRFFTHQKFLGSEKGIDDKEDERLSLSDAYALNRGILTLGQKRSIVEEYRRRRKTTSAFAEWFTIDPPYEPTFGSHKAGTYVNGAISPFTAGELAKGAFGCGYEAYGWDILQRFMKMVEKDGAVYFLYNPKGGNSTTAYLGPSAWGAAALLSAVDEGLAGIVNTGFGYDEIAFSPRWPVTPYRELRYVTGYESVGRYVDCRYVQTEEGFRYHLRSPAKKVSAHLLVPSGKTPKVLLVNGAETSFTLATVGESRYVDVTVTPAGGIADFEVLY